MRGMWLPDDVTDVPVTGLSARDRDRVLTRSFTDVLRWAVGGEVTVSVLDMDTRGADTRMGALLRVPRFHSLLMRRAVLRSATTSVDLAWAESWVVADRLSVTARQDVLSGEAPLGDVLSVHRCDRELLGWLRTTGLPWWATWSDDNVLDRVMLTRTTRVSTGGVPVAVVTEWWPAYDPARLV